MRLVSYLNPLSTEFHAWQDFREKLSLDQKIRTIAVTVFAALLTVGVGTVIAFRLMVERYTFQPPSVAVKAPEAPPSPSKRISALHRPLLVRQTSLALEEKERVEKLSGERLEAYVEKLEPGYVDSFWQAECNRASKAKTAKDIEDAQKRLGTILPKLTEDNFKLLVQLNAFWTVFENPDYSSIAVRLSPQHFEHMSARVREILITTLDAAFQGDSQHAQKCFKNLVEHTPDTFAYLAKIVPHATPFLEDILKAKIRRVPDQQVQLKAQLKVALETFGQKQGIEKKNQVLTPSPTKRVWRYSQSPEHQRDQTKPAESPPPPEKYVLKENESVYQGRFDAEEGPISEDLFFWILSKPVQDSQLEKKQRLVSQFFSTHISPEEYHRLEKMTPDQLSTLVRLLNNLELLWKQEAHASGTYIGQRQVADLQQRLSIEFAVLTQDQLKASLGLEPFWRLLSVYPEVLSRALLSEHFESMAQWLNTPEGIASQRLGDFQRVVGKLVKSHALESQLKAIAPYATDASWEKILGEKAALLGHQKRKEITSLMPKKE